MTAAAAAVANSRERLAKETLRRWAVQPEVDVGERLGASGEEDALLKATSVCFAGELDRNLTAEAPDRTCVTDFT